MLVGGMDVCVRSATVGRYMAQQAHHDGILTAACMHACSSPSLRIISGRYEDHMFIIVFVEGRFTRGATTGTKEM